ncbi:hypothetical protein FACS189479_08170 [Spirochaetia bacterium]|nr:hypothetical protein FACS189479_08170 [Spirochaetia bacterium]
MNKKQKKQVDQNSYKQWLMELKSRIRQSQLKAAVKVNIELLRLYWDLGQDIVVRQMDSVWGSGFFEQLSKELRREFPDMQGFSSRNLAYIKQFYLFYSQENPILHQAGAKLENNQIQQQLSNDLSDSLIFQIPWRHHIEIFTHCESVKEAYFYVQKTIENGWSRAVLMNFDVLSIAGF